MKRLLGILGFALLGWAWLAGIVLAEGFWATAAAIYVPPYAWYLLVARSVTLAGRLVA